MKGLSISTILKLSFKHAVLLFRDCAFHIEDAFHMTMVSYYLYEILHASKLFRQPHKFHDNICLQNFNKTPNSETKTRKKNMNNTFMQKAKENNKIRKKIYLCKRQRQNVSGNSFTLETKNEKKINLLY